MPSTWVIQLIGLGIVGMALEYFLLFVAFPNKIARSTNSTWNQIGGPFIILSLLIFLGTLALGIWVGHHAGLGASSTENLRTVAMWPGLCAGVVLILGATRVTRAKTAFEGAAWKSGRNIHPSRAKSTNPRTCLHCNEVSFQNDYICTVCGYPFSGAALPRKIRLRWGKPLLLATLGIVAWTALACFLFWKNALPLIETKYAGLASTATVIAVHCAPVESVRDASWLEVSYKNVAGQQVRGHTGSKRSECGDALVGQTIAIHYREGQRAVTRDDGTDLFNTKHVLLVYLCSIAFLPLLSGAMHWYTRRHYINAPCRQATVVEPYAQGKFFVEFEKDGLVTSRPIGLAGPDERDRPKLGERIQILDVSEKYAVWLSGKNEMWEIERSQRGG